MENFKHTFGGEEGGRNGKGNADGMRDENGSWDPFFQAAVVASVGDATPLRKLREVANSAEGKASKATRVLKASFSHKNAKDPTDIAKEQKGGITKAPKSNKALPKVLKGEGGGGDKPNDVGKIAKSTKGFGTGMPTVSPQPTSSPTFSPTNLPTEKPTLNPTSSPTFSPTSSPTITFSPTRDPASSTPPPTPSPTMAPTKAPTADPTNPPTPNPTRSPTKAPTNCDVLTPCAAPPGLSDCGILVEECGTEGGFCHQFTDGSKCAPLSSASGYQANQCTTDCECVGITAADYYGGTFEYFLCDDFSSVYKKAFETCDCSKTYCDHSGYLFLGYHDYFDQETVSCDEFAAGETSNSEGYDSCQAFIRNEQGCEPYLYYHSPGYCYFVCSL